MDGTVAGNRVSPLDQLRGCSPFGRRLHWLGRPLASRGLTGLPRVLGPASGLSPHYHLHPHLPSPQEPRIQLSAVLAWSSIVAILPSNLEPNSPLFFSSYGIFNFFTCTPTDRRIASLHLWFLLTFAGVTWEVIVFGCQLSPRTWVWVVATGALCGAFLVALAREEGDLGGACRPSCYRVWVGIVGVLRVDLWWRRSSLSELLCGACRAGLLIAEYVFRDLGG